MGATSGPEINIFPTFFVRSGRFRRVPFCRLTLYFDDLIFPGKDGGSICCGQNLAEIFTHPLISYPLVVKFDGFQFYCELRQIYLRS